MSELSARVEEELNSPAPSAVTALALSLANPARDAAVLYYGSTLRTGDLTGVLDFYRLTRGPHRRGLRGLVERVLWPEVSYHEVDIGGRRLRAKVATVPLAVFRKAAEGRTLDTTIWARFVQPVQRVWAADATCAAAAAQAVVAAVRTGGRFAAALGPPEGTPADFWNALFRRTYATEYRFETTDRAQVITAAGAERYDRILPLAWREAGVPFEGSVRGLKVLRRPSVAWIVRDAVGKPLNLARIAKGAFTFDGAARYAAYKIARHTGVEIEVTPFAERHPLLAAPGAWLRLKKAQAEARRARLSSPNS
jgi:hypothetical protein